MGVCYIAVLCSIQNTVNIKSDSSAQVSWSCAGLSNVPSQFYYFLTNSSAMSTVINSTQQSAVITNAGPPNGVYDMSVTVTMCRAQNGVTACSSGQTTRTACGGVSVYYRMMMALG